MSYTLYLDESMLRSPKMFCVAGEIIKNSNEKKVTNSLNDLKKYFWNKYPQPEKIVLHQTDIRNVQKNFEVYKNNPYRVFGKFRNVKTIFIEVGNIINTYHLPILGCIIDTDFIISNYGLTNYKSSCYYLSLNSIIDSFTHFLTTNNDKGNIVIESLANNVNAASDEEIKKHFFKIMSYGTKHYSAKKLQQKISSIDFYPKKSNNAGLQIADFIPEALLFNKAHISQKPSIYQVIKQNRYIIHKATNPKDSIYGVEFIN